MNKRYIDDNNMLWEFDYFRNIHYLLGKASEADLRLYKPQESVQVTMVDNTPTKEKKSRRKRKKEDD